MDNDAIVPLSFLPDAILARLKTPEGTNRVELHPACPKAFHLGDSSRKMTGDGTFALRCQRQVLCFAIQAEDTTGLNLSALCGKSALALFAADSGKPVTIEEAIPPAQPTGLRGRPQTRPQPRSLTVDEVHVIFLCDQDENQWLVEDLQGVFRSLKDSSLHERVHCLRVNSGDLQGAVDLVQSLIERVCEPKVSA